MAQVWMLVEGEWSVAPLEADRYALTSEAGMPLRTTVDAEAPACAVIRRARAHLAVWALVCPPGSCTVNGEPEDLGLRVLADKDEVRLIGGDRLYFSTERLARIEPFVGAPDVTLCPRCRQPIDAGTSSVACPSCGVRYHEDEVGGLACWTYAPECQVCGASTAVDAAFLWSPAAL